MKGKAEERGKERKKGEKKEKGDKRVGRETRGEEKERRREGGGNRDKTNLDILFATSGPLRGQRTSFSLNSHRHLFALVQSCFLLKLV